MLNAIRKIGLFVAAVVCTAVGLLVGAVIFVLAGAYSALIQAPVRWINRLCFKGNARSSASNGLVNALITAVLFGMFVTSSSAAIVVLLSLMFLHTVEGVYDTLTNKEVVENDLEEDLQNHKTGATMNAADAADFISTSFVQDIFNAGNIATP